MGTKYGACVETGRRCRVSRYFQNLKETLEKPEYKAKNRSEASIVSQLSGLKSWFIYTMASHQALRACEVEQRLI